MTGLKHIQDMSVSEFRKQAKVIIDGAKDDGYVVLHKMSKAKVYEDSITKKIKKHELPRMADVQKIKGLLKEVADMMDKAEKDMIHLIYLAKHCKSLDSEVIDNCNSIADTFFGQIIDSKKFVYDKLVTCDATINLILAANA
jgi:hypothetical protein